ncbi:hypothetical protein ACLRAC_06545 [Gallibacterium anatis]
MKQRLLDYMIKHHSALLGVAHHEICDTLPRNLRHYNCRRFNDYYLI